jgi:NAD(P)-dependent dehydrogenase (short-subunit alcohol dehydrogenase family)
MDLTKDTAVVTGASAGLGRALAIELTRRGLRVAGLGRRADQLAETARLAGQGFTPVTVDVSDARAVSEAMANISKDLGFVGLLINNAAVYPRRDFLDESPGSFMATVAINLGGMVNCSHAVLGEMALRGYGRILNVSTFADLSPIPASSAYAVSKGAAKVFTRALIADICDRFPDIVINDWMPGALATDMGLVDGLDPAVAAQWGSQLALWHDPSLTGTIWERDTEQLAPRSLKRKVKDMVFRSRTVPRTLSSQSPAKA